MILISRYTDFCLNLIKANNVTPVLQWTYYLTDFFHLFFLNESHFMWHNSEASFLLPRSYLGIRTEHFSFWKMSVFSRRELSLCHRIMAFYVSVGCRRIRLLSTSLVHRDTRGAFGGSPWWIVRSALFFRLSIVPGITMTPFYVFQGLASDYISSLKKRKVCRQGCQCSC